MNALYLSVRVRTYVDVNQTKKHVTPLLSFYELRTSDITSFEKLKQFLIGLLVQRAENGYYELQHIYLLKMSNLLLCDNGKEVRLEDIDGDLSWEAFEEASQDVNNPSILMFDAPKIHSLRQPFVTAQAIIYFYMRYSGIYLERIESLLKENKMPGWESPGKNVDGCVAARLLWGNGFQDLKTQTAKARVELEKLEKKSQEESKKRKKSDSDDEDSDDEADSQEPKGMCMNDTRVFVFNANTSKKQIMKSFEAFVDANTE